MNGRLYLEDPYKIEFEAEILEKINIKNKLGIVLDQTCFYPESGGQPSDRGEINGKKVIKVLELNDKVVHLIEEDISEKKVRGIIDWNIRFDHMQQHTGQHILSQSFIKILGAETLSFHIGEFESTIDVNLKSIDGEDIERVELLANEIIYQNRDVKSYFIRRDEVEKYKLRKAPPNKDRIRIVEIEDFDFSACGGTHCKKTGEVGIIKVKKWEKMKGNFRIYFVCGKRALKDYSEKNRIINKLISEFSVNEKEIIKSVERLRTECKDYRKRLSKLQEKLVFYEAEEIIQSSKEKIIKKVFKEREVNEIKYLALKIIKRGDFAVIFGLEKGQRVHLFMGRSEKISVDLRKIVERIAPLIEGRGGGRPDYIEIGGERKENLEKAIDEAYKYIKTFI
ncbi:DHHA1 domain-containing protein [Candidatus Aminicenantes bacterium AC-335-K20]|jgi:alanyl-tRNA synthetase|nr:DHHA1 domain-containing protein [SCandidatus Aminicenantes bacterium Aminicenantia_JdfR_composite]MCP2605497.1 DHHA1 domain-containing protein [Candidatus Aminicenantes bacterium AC-335-O07]MCP2619174.1 DHHA1 domain-containing protein [Candidatus Aminicenantes bacterium AC-335-K20]MCP2620645.1 DHHA1 domain-containing protein [Candidatus Aminicenantes bacterium AC-334-E05]